jgi:hypothetical protein
MARLTPLSKGLIGLAVVGAMASAVWNLVLKEHIGNAPASTSGNPSAPEGAAAAPGSSVTAPPTALPPPPLTAPVAAGTLGLSPAEDAEQGRKLLESGDFAEARRHLERAVQGGDAGAACHLGEMTLRGQGGITANQNAAAQLFQLAQSRNTICFAPGQ